MRHIKTIFAQYWRAIRNPSPVATGTIAVFFFIAGIAIYYLYYYTFERKQAEPLRGLVFFFGILFLIEVSLILIFGVDYRLVNAPYIGESLHIGFLSMSYRLLIPFGTGVIMTLGLHLYLSRTFYGKAIVGVSQDSLALSLMGADPIKIKAIAFGLGIATASIAGALLIIVLPVEPSLGREFIGRVFAVAILGGMGSINGTLVAGIILGIAESLTATFYGAAWQQGVSFGFLLLVLAFRPAGLFGK